MAKDSTLDPIIRHMFPDGATVEQEASARAFFDVMRDMVSAAVLLEREGCAAMAETTRSLDGAHPLEHAATIAAAIRARGPK